MAETLQTAVFDASATGRGFVAKHDALLGPAPLLILPSLAKAVGVDRAP